MGKVVNGSISHSDTLGCLSPAVDSSHPTLMNITNKTIMRKILEKLKDKLKVHVFPDKLSTVNFGTSL